MAVRRIVEGLVHGLRKRRGLDLEDAFPVDHLELVTGRQRLQLVGGEGRILVEQRVDLQQHVEQAVRNLHDRAAGLRRALDLANDVDIVDALQARDVVGGALDAGIDAADDHVAEIADIERLAHVLAVAGYREHRHALHKARQPAQVLAVEPAEHQGRAQHHAVDAGGQHDFFLLALGVGVEILGHRIHHGRADVHGVGHLILLDRCQYVARRRDVVADERLQRRRADLRLQHDHHFRALEIRLPAARFRQIGVDRGDIRVGLAQDLEIGLEFIEHDQIVVALGLQAGYQILADQAGAAGDHDASLFHAGTNQVGASKLKNVVIIPGPAGWLGKIRAEAWPVTATPA